MKLGAPLGATTGPDGVTFRVWAPQATSVEVVITGRHEVHSLAREDDGLHALLVAGLPAGSRYRYLVDGVGPFPDPASRSQPKGVHGPSEVIDPSFGWSDQGWRGLQPDNLVLYELHIGTFTPEGTFRAAIDRLRGLAELGIEAVQIMPVADFAGDRNWGYDGVALFAPSRAYGPPEDLRAFVDAAHALGIGVVLDVVYNHFGPEGAHHAQFSPDYFTQEHHTPWGAAINLDQLGHERVRGFFFQSALHWLHEYHVDGFRLDAVHTLIDDSTDPFLAQFRRVIDEGARPGMLRPVLIAEEHRNIASLVRPQTDGGLGFDVTYADEWHHELYVLLTGEKQGYLDDFNGEVRDLATATRQGWLFTGQYSRYQQESRGTPTEGLAPPRFLHCLQNHDQVGNRAFGERLQHQVSPAAFRAATALLLLSASSSQIFMGDEWGTTSPFLYFTDHQPELGRAVTEGRRAEFRDWAGFRDWTMRDRIPDPQARSTFERSRLRWEERDREPHASVLRLHRALLALRRSEPALRWQEGATQVVVEVDDDTLAIRRTCEGAPPILLIARLRGAGPIGGGGRDLLDAPDGSRWEAVLTTEDPEFAMDPMDLNLDLKGARPWAYFRRPGVLVLRTTVE